MWIPKEDDAISGGGSPKSTGHALARFEYWLQSNIEKAPSIHSEMADLRWEESQRSRTFREVLAKFKGMI